MYDYIIDIIYPICDYFCFLVLAVGVSPITCGERNMIQNEPITHEAMITLNN